MVYGIGAIIVAIVWILGVGFLRAKGEIADDPVAVLALGMGTPVVIFWPLFVFAAISMAVLYGAVKLSTYIMKRFV